MQDILEEANGRIAMLSYFSEYYRTVEGKARRQVQTHVPHLFYDCEMTEPCPSGDSTAASYVIERNGSIVSSLMQSNVPVPEWNGLIIPVQKD